MDEKQCGTRGTHEKDEKGMVCQENMIVLKWLMVSWSSLRLGNIGL
jgi:hypothetical protein